MIKTNSKLLLTQYQIQSIRQEAYEDAQGSDRQLLTMMGTFNAHVWRAIADHDVARKVTGRYEIDPRKFYELFNRDVSMVIAIDWLSGYMKEHWPSAFNSPNTLASKRKWMLEKGFFTFDAESRPKGAFWGSVNGVTGQGVATPPILENVDLVKMLIYYQVFESVLRERLSKKLAKSEDITSFDCFPKHGGMLMVEMYSALFAGISDFRGNIEGFGDLFVPEIETVAIAPQVAWRFKGFKNMAIAAWKKLILRAGMAVKEVVVIQQPICGLADVPY